MEEWVGGLGSATGLLGSWGQVEREVWVVMMMMRWICEEEVRLILVCCARFAIAVGLCFTRSVWARQRAAKRRRVRIAVLCFVAV